MQFTINLNSEGVGAEKLTEVVSRITGALKAAIEAAGFQLTEEIISGDQAALSAFLPGAEQAQTREAMVGELVAKIHERGLVAEDLDELVHECKSSEASDINNSGIDGQARFLLAANNYDLEAALRDISEIEPSDEN